MEGQPEIELRDKTVNLSKGDIIVIPKGIEHKPIAQEEVEVILFEPADTLNTGNVTDIKFNCTKRRAKYNHHKLHLICVQVVNI